MAKILPEVTQRNGVVTVNLSEPAIREEYAKLDVAFSRQVEEKKKKRRKNEREAQEKLGSIVISY